MNLLKLDVQLSTFRLDVCFPSESLIQMATRMGVLLNVNGGQVFLRVVNVTCTDFAWFTFILHRVYHSAREAR